jgi:DNA-binding Lrp family transcriptional regulator
MVPVVRRTVNNPPRSRDDAVSARLSDADPSHRVVDEAPPARHNALDDVDRGILDVLLADGRCSFPELAARVHISRANAYARVARLRADGVLRGFTALVDADAAGVGLTALILVTLDQGAWRAASDRLDLLPGLVYRALTTGEFDCVLLVRVADMHTLRDVVLEELQSIPEVRNSETIFVLDDAGVVASTLAPGTAR